MITTYFSDQGSKWDEIVKSFKNYDVYYLSGYVKAFEINGDGKAMLIYFENGKTRAINVVMKRDIADFRPFTDKIPKSEFYDIVTPYGYGGFIIEGTDTEALKNEYTEFCKAEHIVSEFVRFHPMLKNYEYACDIYEIIPLGNTVYIDTADKEAIWANFSSKNRNMIRKAQREGITVCRTRDKSIIDSFMEIYNATMDKDSANDYYYFKREFYDSVLNDLENNALWFYSQKDGEIAAIAIFMFCNGQMHYHLSGSRSEFKSLAPTNILLYEAALWASENSYKTIHLGGGVGSGEDSLYKFKKAFNRRDDSKFCIGKRIFDAEAYDRLYKIRCNEKEFNKETKFFPQYRG